MSDYTSLDFCIPGLSLLFLGSFVSPSTSILNCLHFLPIASISKYQLFHRLFWGTLFSLQILMILPSMFLHHILPLLAFYRYKSLHRERDYARHDHGVERSRLYWSILVATAPVTLQEPLHLVLEVMVFKLSSSNQLEWHTVQNCHWGIKPSINLSGRRQKESN